MVARWLVAFLATVLLAFGHPALAAEYRGQVLSNYDGDTITVRISDGRTEKVRLLGIDAAEMQQGEWGRRAKEALGKLVAGRQVRLVTDVQERDRYGRMLAYVYVDSTFVNLELVRQGMVMVYTVPPNNAQTTDLMGAQAIAKASGLGVWAPQGGLTQTPSEFRHGGGPGGRTVTNRPTGANGSSFSAARVPARAAPAASGGTVSLNAKSRVYHEPSCRYYDCRNCGQMSLSQAQASGGRPGRCCH